jgi:hypothetical protein
MVGYSAHTKFTKRYTCTGYLTLKHKTPWNFGGVFTPINCPMKNPTGEKILQDYFSHREKKSQKNFSIGERLIHLVHLEEILPLTVSNGVSRKQ